MDQDYIQKKFTGDDLVYLYAHHGDSTKRYLTSEDIARSGGEVTTQKDSTSGLKDHFDEGIKKLSQQISQHDSKQSDERGELIKIITDLKNENEYFRRQMGEQYAPKKLQIKSLIVALTMIISVGFSIFADIDLIHPILSSLILLTAIVFHIMSLVMLKQDSN